MTLIWYSYHNKISEQRNMLNLCTMTVVHRYDRMVLV